MQRGIKIVLLCLVLMLHRIAVADVPENDKRYTFEFSGIPLELVLEEIVQMASVDLIYDPQLLSNYIVYQRIRNKTLAETLAQVLTPFGLDFIILSSGTYVIVKSARGATVFGNLTGLVADAVTGEPLPGATIMLADASGGTVTNISGQFNLAPLITGTHEIIISYVGYTSVRKLVDVAPALTTNEFVLLQPSVINFSPVVVSAHSPFFKKGHKSDSDLASLQLWDGDSQAQSLRSLSLFSGVQRVSAFSNIHIQGGQRGGNRIFLDGAPIYNPTTFGQLFSAFSPFAISRVQVDKAGFGVDAGSFVDGKINLSHEINQSDSYHGMVHMHPLAANLKGGLSLETGTESKFALMTAFRSTYSGFYNDPVLSSSIRQWEMVDPLIFNILDGNPGVPRNFVTEANNSDVDFYDFHLATRFSADRFKTFSFSLYSGRNEVATDILASDVFSGDQFFAGDTYVWDNLATQVRFDWLATPRLELNAQGSFSRNSMNHTYAFLNDAQINTVLSSANSNSNQFDTLRNVVNNGTRQIDTNEINHLIFKTDASYSFSPLVRLKAGLQYDNVNTNLSLTDSFYLPTEASNRSDIFSSYLNGSWFLNRRFSLDAGVRFTTFMQRSTIFAEPRLALQFDTESDWVGFYSIRVSGGIYRQFINQFDITNVGPSSLVPNFAIWIHDASIQQPKSYHGSISLMIQPAFDTQINVEGYYKNQPVAYITSHQNLMVGSDVNRSAFDAFGEITDIQSYGVGVRGQQGFLNQRVQLFAGYDFSYSSVNMQSQFNSRMPAPWNTPHTFQLRALGRVTSSFAVVAKWEGMYGRTWAFRQSYYDFMVPHNFTQESGFSFKRPDKDTFSAFEQLDLSFIYTNSFSYANLEVRLDLMNLLNRENTIDWNLFYPSLDANPEIRKRTLPGFSPAASVSIKF